MGHHRCSSLAPEAAGSAGAARGAGPRGCSSPFSLQLPGAPEHKAPPEERVSARQLPAGRQAGQTVRWASPCRVPAVAPCRWSTPLVCPCVLPGPTSVLSVCLSAGARGRRGQRVSSGNTKTQRRGGGLAFGAGSPRHLQPQTGSEGGTLPSFAPALCRRLPSLPSCSWCQPEKRGKARSFSPSVLAVL